MKIIKNNNGIYFCNESNYAERNDGSVVIFYSGTQEWIRNKTQPIVTAIGDKYIHKKGEN